MRWLVVALVLAGCADPEVSLSGSFTQDRPDTALEEVSLLAAEHGGSTAIMESYPEQFRISGLAPDACEDLRDILAEKPWIQTLGTCRGEGSSY